MLRHIVMIKYKEGQNLSEVAENTRKQLLALEKSIEPLLKMEVGLNISARPSAYDLVLVADFDDEQGLEIYRDHTEHLKVLDYLKTVMEKATVVDYFI